MREKLGERRKMANIEICSTSTPLHFNLLKLIFLCLEFISNKAEKKDLTKTVAESKVGKFCFCKCQYFIEKGSVQYTLNLFMNLVFGMAPIYLSFPAKDH